MSTTREWYDSKSTCEELCISRSTLQALKDNYLEAGVHYYRRGLGTRGPILWNLPSIRQLMIKRSAGDSSND